MVSRSVNALRFGANSNESIVKLRAGKVERVEILRRLVSGRLNTSQLSLISTVNYLI